MWTPRFYQSVLLVLTVLTLSGCASSMMHKVEPVGLESQPDKALVTFMRPSFFGGAIQFGIWDSDNFIGVLSAGSSVQYLAEPGDHVFLGRAENWSYVKAELEAGKQYFVIGRVFPGVWKARVALDPVNNGDEDVANIEKWQKELTPTAINAEQREAYITPRLEQVKTALGQIDNGTTKFEVLSKADGR